MEITRDTLYLYYPSSWWHDLWREGLVSGNGLMGINCYGGNKKETTMLIHNELWHGGKKAELPDVSAAFKELRSEMDRNNFKEASWKLVDALKAKDYQARLESPLPLADLNVIFNSGHGFKNYKRAMQLDSGEISSEWREETIEYVSKQFVSRKNDTVIKQISASQSVLDLSFELTLHLNQGSNKKQENYQFILDSKVEKMEDDFLIYHATNDDGKYYGAVAYFVNQEGAVEYKAGKLTIKGAHSILIFIKSFVKSEDSEATIKGLKKELLRLSPDYEKHLHEHKKLHKALYKSAKLELPYTGFHSNEELLMTAYRDEASPELIEKLWKFGRYLFICGTTEHSNPFPLYGLWGGDYRLMWGHNMANVNIQMMYWHSFVGNLLPFNKAFCEYYNAKIPTFQENAQKLFGMKGIYLTVGTTPGVSSPNQVVPVIINWVHAAGWIAQHYYNLYRYNKNERFLQETAWPYFEEVAAFYEDFIEAFPDGKIKLYPSVSPENTPGNFMTAQNMDLAHPMPTAVNSTLDLAIVKEFFTHLIRIAQEEHSHQNKVKEWEGILNAIPNYQSSNDGGISEWQDSRFDERYEHRHLSHLYPVFPGNEVNDRHHQDLLPAFKKAAELRKIDAQTGWSMTYMSAIYARFNDSFKAMETLNNMVKSTLTNNFFSLHNDWRGMNLSLTTNPAPVQLDGNMGLVNAIQEMILYVSEDFLKLLPALPKVLQKGKIKNFRYMDGTIKMCWDKEEKNFSCTFYALSEHKITIKLPEFVDPQCMEMELGSCQLEQKASLLKVTFEKKGYLKISTR